MHQTASNSAVEQFAQGLYCLTYRQAYLGISPSIQMKLFKF